MQKHKRMTMNKADDDEELQSAKVGTGHHSGGRHFWLSPITAQPSQEDNGYNEVDALKANYENPMAASVEEYFSVPQSMLPPPAIEDSNKK